jgi:hypothetical protein
MTRLALTILSVGVLAAFAMTIAWVDPANSAPALTMTAQSQSSQAAK